MFSCKLIPEFDGSGSMVEWIKKVKLVCDLCGVKRDVIPLQLTFFGQKINQGGKSNTHQIKDALFMAFAADNFK